MMRLRFSFSLAASFALATLAWGGDQVLLNEDFENYASADEIIQPTGPWTFEPSDGGGLPPSLRDSGGTQFIELSRETRTDKPRNGLLSRAFDPPAAKGTIRLTARMLHGSDGTGQYIGLFTKDLTKGYAIYWTAGAAPTAGNAHITRFELQSPLKWTTRGVNLATVKNAEMTHDAQTQTLAEFELVIDLDSGALSLSLDGVEKITATDPAPIRDLSAVVVRGNGGGLFDDIHVTLKP